MREQACSSGPAAAVSPTQVVAEGISEVWNLSQFWYSQETADFLANAAIRHAGVSGSIACLSTPTLFRALKRLGGCAGHRVVLFEYDRRFACFGDEYVFYDLYKPTALPESMLRGFDFVACDPPHLDRETVADILLSASLLARTPATPTLLLTAAALESVVAEVTGGSLARQPFTPTHDSGRLQNEFASYANFSLSCSGGEH
jgi:hypothetical protein